MKPLALYCCISLLIGATPAFAQHRVDPFLSNTEAGGTFEDEVGAVKEVADEEAKKGTQPDLRGQRFSNGMERLLRSAGIDTTGTDSSWANFEDATQQHEDNYHSSFEWQMQNENAKALDKPAPFDNGLEYVEEKLKEIGGPEKDLKKEIGSFQRGGIYEDEKDRDEEK